MTHIDAHADAQPRRGAEQPEADLAGFLSGLTELSLAHGIGIADAPTLYVLEREDRDFSYEADKDGRLVLR